jgi:Tol biopolymer transport system component
MDKRYELYMTLGWSADGSVVLADLIDTAEARQEIVAWVSVADGAVRPLLRHGLFQAFVSPDGAWVAYGANARQGDGVFIIPSRGGNPRLVDVTPKTRKVAGWSPDGSYLLMLSAHDRGDDLYAVPVADGRPSGEPKLIRRLSSVVSLGISKPGGLLLRSSVGPTREVYRADFDATTGRIGAPSLVSASTHAILSVATWSPDGMSIAYVSGSVGRTLRTISIWSVVSGQTRTFTLPFELASTKPAWSPDGRWVQLSVRDERGAGLIRVNVDSGATEPILPPDSGAFPPARPGQPSGSLLAWSADGRIVYKSVRYPREGGLGSAALVEHRLSDHAEREIFRSGEGSSMFGFALSPDGRQIAIRIQESKPLVVKLVVLPVAGGSAKTVAEWPGQGAASVTWTPDGRKLLTPYSIVQADPEERLMCDIESGTITKLAIALEQVSSLAVSPDGKSIVYVGGPKQRDDGIWLLENFLPKGAKK